MPQQIDIFIHTADCPGGRTFRVNDAATVEELIREIFPEGHEEILLVVEGEDHPSERHHRLHECGIKHGHHVHLRHHHHHPGHHESHEVVITINNVERKTHRGLNSIEHLRKIGEVPVDEILSEFKGGQFVDLIGVKEVEICGGEIFASHVPSGGSA